VRVRHLIHHTAGLPDVWPRLQQAGDEDRTSQAMLAALAESPQLDNEPGSEYAYANEGYICLATIVERISGVTLDAFARTHIFEPLGMTRSLFWAGPSPAPRTAAVMPVQHGRAPLSVGDGGLWTSVGDLLRWNAAILDDSLGIAATIHAPGSLDDGTPLDYAWGVHVFDASGQTVQSHGGDYGTATAKLVRIPARCVGFAALAADASVDRMTRLGDALLRESING
jgi:CubicO group peptidase (beta-lactamase class C family)